MGEGGEACSANSFHGTVTAKANQAGVLIDENAFNASLKVQNNAGGSTPRPPRPLPVTANP